MRIRAAADSSHPQVLHIYYQSELEDRLIVERILHSCLVPYQLPNEVSIVHFFRQTLRTCQHITVMVAYGVIFDC